MGGLSRLGACAVVLVATSFPGRGAGGREEFDVPYRPGAGPRERADLYLPDGRDWPTLVFVHGGSLEVGDRKSDSIPALCRRLVLDGIGCVSVGYRLFSDGVTWPTPATDVAAGYAWARTAVASRGGDPRRVFLGGHSSGCSLATVVGAEVDYLAPHGLSPRDVPIEDDAHKYVAAAKAAGRDVVRIEILADRKHYTALARMADPEDPGRALLRGFLGR